MAGQRIFDTLTLDSAPREAPTAFAQPKAEPLASPDRKPGVEVSGAIAPPDSIRSPADPGPALESLAPAVQAPRDPHEPFESTSLLVTTAPGKHDPKTPFELSSASTASTQFAPPDASSLVTPAAPGTTGPSGPEARQPAPAQAPRAVNNYPLGGSWSGDPAPGRRETPNRLTGPLVILTDTGMQPYGVGNLLRATGAGMLSALAIGFIIRPLSLTMLILAWILSMTAPRSRRLQRSAFLIALGIMTVVIVLATLRSYEQPLTTANSVAQWVCLAMVLVSPRLTRSDLARTGRIITAEQAQAMIWAAAPQPPAGSDAGHGPQNGAAEWPQPPAAGVVPPNPPRRTAPRPNQASGPSNPVPGPPMHAAPPTASQPGQAGAPQPPYPGYPGRQGSNW